MAPAANAASRASVTRMMAVRGTAPSCARVSMQIHLSVVAQPGRWRLRAMSSMNRACSSPGACGAASSSSQALRRRSSSTRVRHVARPLGEWQARAGIERGAHLLCGAVQAGLHGADRQPEGQRGLVHRQSQVVVQDDERPLLGRQAREGAGRARRDRRDATGRAPRRPSSGPAPRPRVQSGAAPCVPRGSTR